jgi:hypothetical protein
MWDPIGICYLLFKIVKSSIDQESESAVDGRQCTSETCLVCNSSSSPPQEHEAVLLKQQNSLCTWNMSVIYRYLGPNTDSILSTGGYELTKQENRKNDSFFFRNLWFNICDIILFAFVGIWQADISLNQRLWHDLLVDQHQRTLTATNSRKVEKIANNYWMLPVINWQSKIQNETFLGFCLKRIYGFFFLVVSDTLGFFIEFIYTKTRPLTRTTPNHATTYDSCAITTTAKRRHRQNQLPQPNKHLREAT